MPKLTKDQARLRKLHHMRDMQGNLSELSTYIAHISANDDGGAKSAEDLRSLLTRVFTSEDGLKCLVLFEKAVLLSSAPNGSSDGALRERNAVRNFVTDLMRIAAHG